MAVFFRYCRAAIGTVMLVACSATEPDSRTAEEILDEYLRLSFAGAQFSKEGIQTLNTLSAQPVQYDRSASISIATSYAIRNLTVQGEHGTALIRYRPVGFIKEIYSFEPHNKIWEAPIELTRRSDGWKVEPKTTHVEPETVIRVLNDVLNQDPAAGEEWKAHIRKSIVEIKRSAEEAKRWPNPRSMTPEALLNAYLDMDAAGGQLTNEGRDAMQGLTTDALHEDSLRLIQVTKGYDIVSNHVQAEKAAFAVVFKKIELWKTTWFSSRSGMMHA